MWGSESTTNAPTTQGDSEELVPGFCVVDLGPIVSRVSVLYTRYLAVVSKPFLSRGAARCALHVHGRGARTDACGRSFEVLSAQASTVGCACGL